MVPAVVDDNEFDVAGSGLSLMSMNAVLPDIVSTNDSSTKMFFLVLQIFVTFAELQSAPLN